MFYFAEIGRKLECLTSTFSIFILVRATHKSYPDWRDGKPWVINEAPWLFHFLKP